MILDINDQPIRVLMINGPPGCGKDTLANYIVHGSKNTHHMKFAQPLRQMLQAVLFCTSSELQEYLSYKLKDELIPMLDMSPRDFMIWASEDMMKPKFGQSIFGKIMLQQLIFWGQDAVISDCGFISEVVPVIKAVGEDHARIVHIHRDGCSYDSDSRSYIYPDVIRYYSIRNDGSKRDLYAKAEDAVRWLWRVT